VWRKVLERYTAGIRAYEGAGTRLELALPIGAPGL
jgi:hypothetical protein